MNTRFFSSPNKGPTKTKQLMLKKYKRVLEQSHSRCRGHECQGFCLGARKKMSAPAQGPSARANDMDFVSVASLFWINSGQRQFV